MDFIIRLKTHGIDLENMTKEEQENFADKVSNLTYLHTQPNEIIDKISVLSKPKYFDEIEKSYFATNICGLIPYRYEDENENQKNDELIERLKYGIEKGYVNLQGAITGGFRGTRYTIVGFAKQRFQTELVKYLLEKGANPNDIDNKF